MLVASACSRPAAFAQAAVAAARRLFPDGDLVDHQPQDALVEFVGRARDLGEHAVRGRAAAQPPDRVGHRLLQQPGQFTVAVPDELAGLLGLIERGPRLPRRVRDLIGAAQREEHRDARDDPGQRARDGDDNPLTTGNRQGYPRPDRRGDDRGDDHPDYGPAD